jgi:hypothetical protein
MRFPFYALLLLMVVLAGCAREHKTAEASTASPMITEDAYPYTRPLTSLGAKFGALPAAVQNTVRAEAGMTEVSEIEKKITTELVYYVIYFRDAKNFPPLYIAPDGSVLRPDLTVAVPAPRDISGGLSAGPSTTVTLKDLPAPVSKALQDRVPGADLASLIASMKREAWGDHVVYTILFKEEAHTPTLRLVAEGHVLEPVPPAKTP